MAYTAEPTDQGDIRMKAIFRAAAFLLFALFPAFLVSRDACAETKPFQPGSKDYKLYQDLLKKVKPSDKLKEGWFVEGPTYRVHSTISQEYTAAAAVHLDRFYRRFKSIFREEFKDLRKPIAFGFATEAQYFEFDKSAKGQGTQGRFSVRMTDKGLEKNLAWFSTPIGEKDFYKTDFGVVQHEATHQLLDAYTDNQGIPRWFHEGSASFFESWDLDQDNAKNILSGLSGRYGMGICLSYPRQKPAPVLIEYWIEPRKLLSAQQFEELDEGPRQWPPKKDAALDFKKHMITMEQYNEAWCTLAFFIDNPVGRQVFTQFVSAFRENSGLEDIKAKLYTEEFLKSFEKEWSKFIEKKVLGKWEMQTVGGRTLRVGDMRPPPAETEGFPLTDDRRCDLFFVSAEAGVVPKAFEKETWWMLKAWGVPIRIYREAWKLVPDLAAGRNVKLVGGVYVLWSLAGPEGPGSRVFLLVPVWSPPLNGEGFRQRLGEAAQKLIAKARGKEKEGVGANPQPSDPANDGAKKTGK